MYSKTSFSLSLCLLTRIETQMCNFKYCDYLYIPLALDALMCRFWFDSNLDGSQSFSECCRDEKSLCSPVTRFEDWKGIHKYCTLKRKGDWLIKILWVACFQFTFGSLVRWCFVVYFTTLPISQLYGVNGRITSECWIGKDVGGRLRVLTQVLRRHLPSRLGKPQAA